MPKTDEQSCAEILEGLQLSEPEANAFGRFLSRVTPAVLATCTVDELEMNLAIDALAKVRKSMALFGVFGDTAQADSTIASPGNTFGTS